MNRHGGEAFASHSMIFKSYVSMKQGEQQFRLIDGGVAAPGGFVSAGISCGIKGKGKKDLALVYSEQASSAAGAFSANQVQAAPVKLSRKYLKKGKCQAVIINSGLANACTGERGERDALRMVQATASALGIEPELVAVCSTGRIGGLLPIGKIESGISSLVEIIKKGGNNDAADAIMTTDTRSKVLAVEFEIGKVPVRIGGMAKGAGMIYPKVKVAGLNQATMLAFITTNAGIKAGLLKEMLFCSLEQSFNRITVDGDTSTNDAVILMANDSSGVYIEKESPFQEIFQAALNSVTRKLAGMIVADGEGATKFIEIEVRGARSKEEARTAASAVGNSNLFKCAIYGETPNWGRIMAALGCSGAELEEHKVSVFLADVEIITNGLIADVPEDLIRKKLGEKKLRFVIDLGLGQASETLFTCDLTPEYVEINKQ